MQKVFDISYTESIAYKPFSERVEELNPALKKLADKGKFPYATDGLAYFEVVRSFVREWLSMAGDAATDKHAKAFYDVMKKSSNGQKHTLPPLDSSPDAMTNLLSTIIFTVTAYHELIGHVIDYAILPSRAAFRLTKNGDPMQADIQAFLLTATIAASTSIKMPMLMKKFPNFFGAGDAPPWERDVWDSFIGNLQVQSDKVQELDEKRDVEFKYFDPSRFECSVSV